MLEKFSLFIFDCGRQISGNWSSVLNCCLGSYFWESYTVYMQGGLWNGQRLIAHARKLLDYAIYVQRFMDRAVGGGGTPLTKEWLIGRLRRDSHCGLSDCLGYLHLEVPSEKKNSFWPSNHTCRRFKDDNRLSLRMPLDINFTVTSKVFFIAWCTLLTSVVYSKW